MTYRYWDATACVAFGHRMAEQALEQDLRGETEYLADFDQLLRAVDDRFDIREATWQAFFAAASIN